MSDFTFFLSFTFIKRLCSSSLLSAIRVVSSTYLKLLIFLPAVLIPACASSSPAFLMLYFAHKLNNQGDDIQPWHIPFPIWNQSVVPCPVLTVASWLAYRFLKRQVRWSGVPTYLRIFQRSLIQQKFLSKQHLITYWKIYLDPGTKQEVSTILICFTYHTGSLPVLKKPLKRLLILAKMK